MHKLYAHQQLGLDLLLDHESYALFWDCGTGKTLPAARAADIRLGSGEIDTLLVMCPKAAMWNWVKELHQNSENFRRAIILDGNKKERKEELALATEYTHSVVISNYAKLALHQEEFTKLLTERDVMIIFDESHYIKNWEAERTKQAVALADLAVNVVLLTGTPIGRDVSDIWSQYRALDGGETFGDNYYRFRREYMNSVPNVPGMWTPKSDSSERIRELMWNKADLKRKEDCLDLPDIRFDKYWIELSEKTARIYKKLADTLIAEFEAKGGDMSRVEAVNAAVATMKLQQITSGFAIDDEGEIRELDEQPKLDALKQIMSELPPDEKVVVWARFTRDVRQVIDALEEYSPLSIESKHSAEERQDTIELFQQDNKHRVIVSNPQCGGAAITLTRANVAIYYSNSYNFIDRRQSLDRIHRIGQEKKVRYIDIVADGTVDIAVLEALSQRKDLVDFLCEVAIADVIMGRVKSSDEEDADVHVQRGQEREGDERDGTGGDEGGVEASVEVNEDIFQVTEARVEVEDRGEADLRRERGGGQGSIQRLNVGRPGSSDGDSTAGGVGEGLQEPARQEGPTEHSNECGGGAFRVPSREDVATFDGDWG